MFTHSFNMKVSYKELFIKELSEIKKPLKQTQKQIKKGGKG